jgi:hypothetical protein
MALSDLSDPAAVIAAMDERDTLGGNFWRSTNLDRQVGTS